MRRHLAWRLLIPIGLGALVVALAVLQYRWLGQVGESERQELRHSFERRAQDFAAEADNESGKLYQAFKSLVDGTDEEVAATLAAQLATWKKADRYPGLVRAIYVVNARGPHDTVLRFDETKGTLDAVSAPPEIAPVFERLSFGMKGDFRNDAQSFTQVIAIGGAPFISEIPAWLIWLPRRDNLPIKPGGLPVSPPLPMNMLMRAPVGERAIVVQLDRQLLVEQVLRAMLANHFGERVRVGSPSVAPNSPLLPPRLYEAGFPVRLQIVDAANKVILTAGMNPGESIAADRADVTTPFFVPTSDSNGQAPGDRFLAWTRNLTPPAKADARFTVRVERQEIAGDVRVKMAQDSWRLLIQHGAGSLDQAVAITRRRNLYLSFGILSVLAVAMGLVVGNAQRSEKLAAQQMEFVATVSHELRTPVAVIRSAAENLSSGIVHEPAQTRRYGELIEAEGRRLTDMLEHVLEHANIRANRVARRRTDVDVAQLVRDTVQTCEPMISRAGMTTDVEIDPDLPRLPADEPALRQALENLIGNAVKHAAEGKWIGIKARLAAPDGRHVVKERRLGAGTQTRPVQVIELVVSDRGPGVDSTDREHLFDAFYRGRRALERQVQGSGLGLSLVKRIVEEHYGRIEVDTQSGGGASFIVRLPVLPDWSTRGAGTGA